MRSSFTQAPSLAGLMVQPYALLSDAEAKGWGGAFALRRMLLYHPVFCTHSSLPGKGREGVNPVEKGLLVCGGSGCPQGGVLGILDWSLSPDHSEVLGLVLALRHFNSMV